jgi:hypothetical protein
MYRLDMENIHCLMMPKCQQVQDVHAIVRSNSRFTDHLQLVDRAPASVSQQQCLLLPSGKAIQSHRTPHAIVSLDRLISSTLYIPITVLFI